MSDMKYDAIINSGIKIVERIPIPPELIPKDAQVEIAAKVMAFDIHIKYKQCVSAIFISLVKNYASQVLM